MLTNQLNSLSSKQIRQFRLPATLITMGIVIMYAPWLIVIYSVASYYSFHNLDIDQEVVRGFIEWFGTVYSIFITLVLLTVSARYETVDREFDQELDAMVTLHQTVNHVCALVDAQRKRLPPEIENIVINIKLYIDHVITNHEIEHADRNSARQGKEILENIGREISLLKLRVIKYKINDSLFTQLFESLNEASDIRGDRISHTKQHTPIIARVIAFASSILWLLAFFVLSIHDPILSVLVIGGATVIIMMVLGIVEDLRNPFEGSWKVNFEDWNDFKESLEK